MDIHEIAQELTASTPDAAARSTARLLNAVMDQQRTPQALVHFMEVLSAELEHSGMFLAQALKPAPFSLLARGDLFITSDGMLCRKIDPIPQAELRGEVQPPLTALNLKDGTAVHIGGTALVHRLDLEP
jgi:hypothetical protein